MHGPAESLPCDVFRSEDPEQFGRALQGVRMEYMPRLGRRLRAELRVRRLGAFTAQHVAIGPCLGRGVIEPGVTALVLPLRHPPGATIANGAALDGRDALLVRGAAELFTSSDVERSWLSIAFSERCLPDLLPEGARPIGSATILRMPRPVASRLRAALLLALSGGTAPEGDEAAIGSLVAEALATASQGSGPRRATREALRVLRLSEELLQARMDRPLQRDDLCAALGVSRRKLHDAFAATVGLSPPAYLKLRRLFLARRALRARPDEPLLVKTVALSHGFSHLGHFAQDDRALFGELPSETCRR